MTSRKLLKTKEFIAGQWGVGTPAHPLIAHIRSSSFSERAGLDAGLKFFVSSTRGAAIRVMTADDVEAVHEGEKLSLGVKLLVDTSIPAWSASVGEKPWVCR